MDYCPHCMTPATGQLCPACGKSVHWQAPTNQLPVGTLLRSSGDHVYQLGAAKGQGGFGITYAAMDLRTNTRVAIKEFFPSHCAGRDTMTRVICATGHQDNFATGLQSFLQEAKTLSSVGALESVVSVRDFFESNGTAYIVMEYVDGSGLNDVVAKRGPMRKQELFPILQPLLRDLAILHRAGVIHRDISPDNLILTKEGKLKLLDFGSARSVEAGKAMTVMLKAGFSPLEQYQSKGQGPYTDVYAMAGTIYYCLTGRVPPISVDRIQEDELRAPNDFGAGLTQREQDALLWGLSVHAHQRPQNVEAFANALLGGAGQPVFEPPVRRETQPGYPQSGYPQNRPDYPQPQPPQKGGFGKGLAIGLAAAVAAVALLIGGLAIGGVFGGGKTPDRDRDDDDDERIHTTAPAATRPMAPTAGATEPMPTEPAAPRDLLVNEDGFLYYIDSGEAVIAGYEGTKTGLTFPDELDGCPVTVLDVGCLEGNTTVQNILLPLECTEIRANAFRNCTDLRRISCYSTLTADPSAFTGCTRFRAVLHSKGADMSGWGLPEQVRLYTREQDIGIGGLSFVHVDDLGVTYGMNGSEQAAILDIPASVTYLEVPETFRDAAVLWIAAGAMDRASSGLSVYMCPDMGFDPSLLNKAKWDCEDGNDFCWSWYVTCVVLEDVNGSLTGRRLTPDRIAVEAAMIRAEELERHYDFNIRPDGGNTPDLLNEMGLVWDKATIYDGTIDCSTDELYDQQFDEVYDGLVSDFSGTHTDGDYYDAIGVAFWYSETEGMIYVYGIGIVR